MKSASIVVVLFLFSFSAWADEFLETFDDEDLEGWQELNSLNAVPGSWEILDGELQGINPGRSLRFLTTGAETWKDYDIEVDVKPLKKHGTGEIGIVVRLKGTWAIWCRITDLLLNDPESKVMCSCTDVLKITGVVFHMEPHPLLRLNKWSALKLSVNEDHLVFWINGKKIVETRELAILRQNAQEIVQKVPGLPLPPTNTGRAGFGLSNYTVRFDNITITGKGIPNKGGLSVLPRVKLATIWGSLKQF